MEKLLRLSSAINKYLLAAILLAVPLYPKFPFINIPGTFVSIRLEDLLLFLAILSTFIHLMIDKKERIFVLTSPVVRSIVVYLAVGALSVAAAVVITSTVVPHIGLLHFLRRIEYFAGFLVAMGVVYRSKNIEDYIIKLILVVLGIVFIYGLGQKYFNLPIVLTQNEEYSKGIALRYVPGGHINSTFAGHYDLATYMILTLPIVVSLFVLSKDRVVKIFTAFTTVGGVWLLVNSASRISFFSYLVAVFVALLLLKKYWHAIVICGLSFAFIGLSSNLIARYSRFFEVFFAKYISFEVSEVYAASPDEDFSRILPTPTPTPVFEDRSTNIRLAVEWPRAIRALEKNPLLGTGYSSITLATDNDYLRALGETGVLGFVAFVTILITVARIYTGRARNVLRYGSDVQKSFISGFAGAFTGMLINALFIDVFEASKVAITFWVICGVAYTIAIIHGDKKGLSSQSQ